MGQRLFENDLVMVFVYSTSSDASQSLTDTFGLAWTQRLVQSSVGGSFVWEYYAKLVTNKAVNITINTPIGVDDSVFYVIDTFAGVNLGVPFDPATSPGASSSSVEKGTGTSGQTLINFGSGNHLVLSFLASDTNSTFTPGSNYELRGATKNPSGSVASEFSRFSLGSSSTNYPVDFTLSPSANWVVVAEAICGTDACTGGGPTLPAEKTPLNIIVPTPFGKITIPIPVELLQTTTLLVFASISGVIFFSAVTSSRLARRRSAESKKRSLV